MDLYFWELRIKTIMLTMQEKMMIQLEERSREDEVEAAVVAEAAEAKVENIEVVVGALEV